MMRSIGRLLLLCLTMALPARLAAQRPAELTRAQAVALAASRGARLELARADTSAAFAALLTARARQNPALSASYSKATPQYHVALDLPVDYPWQRRGRIGAAQAGRTAAQYRFAFERAAAALDADTTYTRALAARSRIALSRRNAQDADSLRVMAIARRDAGDASDLDVELATVNAGQQANLASADSLAFISTVLDLQAVIGLSADSVVVTPTDSLVAPPADSSGAASRTASRASSGAPAGLSSGRAPAGSSGTPAAGGSPLQVAAAQSTFESAQLAAALQHRSIFVAPSISAGFERGDPTGAEPGFLPTVGLSLPLPLLDRNRGPIAQAEAERARARAELTLARLTSATEIARGRRGLAVAQAKVERDQLLVVAARRVATMSLTAYREGASSLPNVLEAQRNARDVVGQYVADVADAWIAAARLRVLTLTPDSSVAP